MDKLKKLVDKLSLKGDIIIVLMGIALLISLAFVFKNPWNKTAVLTAFVFGGLLNSFQGLKYMRNSKNKSTGMSFIMLGILFIVIGFIINTER